MVKVIKIFKSADLITNFRFQNGLGNGFPINLKMNLVI